MCVCVCVCIYVCIYIYIMMVMIYCSNNTSLCIVSPHTITLYMCNLYNCTVVYNIGDRRNVMS